MDYDKLLENPSLQTFLLAGLFIYAIFRFLHFLNKKYVFKLNFKYNIQRLLYFIELISWLIFIAESASYFAQKNIIIAALLALVLLVIVGWTSWFVVKDYLAGLYLRLTASYKLNEMLEFDGLSGKIIRLGDRGVEIETSALHSVKVPYSKLFTSRVVRTRLSDLTANSSFVLSLDSKINTSEAIESIRLFIYQLPWCNLTHKPVVLVERQEKKETIIRISASVIDEKYLERFESKVRNKFE